MPGLNVVAIYALIGVQENRHWLEVNRELHSEILLRLGMMGLTSKKPSRRK